jgi:hypothetical protein
VAIQKQFQPKHSTQMEATIEEDRESFAPIGDLYWIVVRDE